MAVNSRKAALVESAGGEDRAGTEDTGLPAIVEAAWGIRDRPARGPKRGLSLQRIVEAGVKVAASDGLAAVSMSRVAADLGASTMSLYRYVNAKDELLKLMMDAAMGVPPAVPPREGWRAGLSQWAWAMRTVSQRHPWALRVPISSLPVYPHEVAWFEQGLGCMRQTPLAEAQKASVIMLLAGYVRNAAATDADIAAAIRASGTTPDEWMASYARLLTRVTDAQRFPAIASFMAAGVFEVADDPDDEFIFGLERILDGIDVLVSRLR
jgi:AcrR family transcriptional regulator